MPLLTKKKKRAIQARILSFLAILALFYGICKFLGRFDLPPSFSRPFFVNANVLYGIFVLLSLILIFFAINPHTLTNFAQNYNPNNELDPNFYVIVGKIAIITSHHEGEFKLHEIRLGNKLVCSGCLGTITGLILGIIIYPIFQLETLHEFITMEYQSQLLFVSSWFCISVSLLKYWSEITGIGRLGLNTLFPLGVWLYFIAETVHTSISIKFMLCFLSLIAITVIMRLHLMRNSHLS